MKIHRLSIAMLVAAMWMATTSAVAAKANKIQRKQLLNAQWQFVENDSDFTHAQTVTLPHDWSILHRFDKNAPAGGAGGYLPAGKGWYRRTLTLGRG